MRALKRFSNPARAKASVWFFKTGKGEYGEGDRFIGITVPSQRKVARMFRELPLPEVRRLLMCPVHEFRLTALFILVDQFRRATSADRRVIVDLYLKHTRWINNWDLVDSSAPYILGVFLLDESRVVLYRLAKSRNLWERRIAMLATSAFIDQKDFRDTLKMAKLLLNDKHDLIHKAVGWMLREVGNRDRKAEEKFLKKYASRMPRTMLRYAIEKFEPSRRAKYLSLRD
ncbi:MAG: alkylation repair enzyme superfamily protein [Parcubacteria group bacterium GW2011_GWC2_49_9]|nr:MAG: alkylation repair enzyme superfamily protein [Parcubacteria group bacterium GW2011_GWA2_48_9]KKW13698.1 MAG: alkylation repair enzyme superfamily protein [Parcubacteria group bacterium GW2011_GWC2_49_9]